MSRVALVLGMILVGAPLHFSCADEPSDQKERSVVDMGSTVDMTSSTDRGLVTEVGTSADMRNSSDMAAPNDTGSNGDGSIATDGGSEPDPAPYVKPGPWAQMTTEERHAFMEHVVEPEMRELFVAFDSEEFADFGCETCHGENADEVEYDMPNTVTALSLDDFPLTNSSDPRIREFAVFMDDEVKPQMAAFLDRTPRPQGDFGCLACHGRL